MQLLIYSNYTDKHTDAGVMPLLACGLKYSTIWLVNQRKPSSRQAVSTVSKSRLQTTPTVGSVKINTICFHDQCIKQPNLALAFYVCLTVSYSLFVHNCTSAALFC